MHDSLDIQARGRGHCSLLHMGGLFHEIFPRFHYFHVFFKLGTIIVAIATKVHRYSDEYCLPQKAPANTRGLQ
jgi:hypothetical protein